MRGCQIAAAAVVCLAAAGAGDAAAATYGGGRLPTIHYKRYTPGGLVTLRTGGGRLRARCVTTLKCGRDIYPGVTDTGSAVLRNGRATWRGRGGFGLERGRLRFR